MDGRNISLAGAAASLALALACPSDTLVGNSSTWRYRDNGADLGTTWRNTNYSESGWSTGTQPLGFGDPVATLVTAGHMTYYFRQWFAVTNPAQYGALRLQGTFDDGAIVYLNGIEVWRYNMPTGTVTHTNAAAYGLGQPEEGYVYEESISAWPLVTGSNLVAVEIHQIGSGSSDVMFNFTLQTEKPVMTTGADSFAAIPFGSIWRYRDNGSNQGTAWRGSSFVDTNWPRGFAPFGYGESNRVVTTNSYGTNAANKHITTYFRTTFVTEDSALHDIVRLRGVVDDGMIVYINSNEVWRYRMPTGTVSYTNPAASNPGNDEETDIIEQSVAAAACLVDGTNVVAVELHQVGPGSSDLFLDFELRLESGGADWAEGPAALGYDIPGAYLAPRLATPLEELAQGVARYFRTTFTIDHPADVDPITFFAQVDDGALIYLNGSEVWRYNMPAGGITPSTLASNEIAYPAETNTLSFVVDPAFLVYGENVLSAEIHPASSENRDLFFKLWTTNEWALEAPSFFGASTNTSLDGAVKLNEWSAANLTAIRDPVDLASAPWFELFNGNAEPANLEGWLLATNTTTTNVFTIPPDTSVPAYGFRMVWCDGETNQNELADDLHITPPLSPTGGTLVLMLPDRRVVDQLVYDAQPADQADGYFRDGIGGRFRMSVPTPGASNWVMLAASSRVDMASGNGHIRWSTRPTWSYQLYYTDAITNSNWQASGSQFEAITDFTESALPLTNRKRFYKLVEIQP